MEGKTERRLVSRMYEKITDKTLRGAKIGLVGAGGRGIIPKCYKILDAMGVNARALVDLDFVFQNAIQNGLLKQEDEHIQSCRQKHNEEAGRLNSADGARQLVERRVADTEIQRLHEKMKNQDYWVWTAGAIEDHLGVDGKSESAWADFNEQLKENEFEEVVEDPEGVRELVGWLNNM